MKERGITLIALIVTIIIIIILAAVTTSVLMSTGLIDKAIAAAKKYQKAQYNEIDEIDKILKSIGGTENKEILMPSVEYAQPEGENGWYKSNIEIAVSSENTDNITNFAYKLSDKKGNTVEQRANLNKEGDTITIEKDGEFTLAVWAVNDKAERSEIKVIENLKKDAAGPQGLALTVDEENIGENEIPVTANVTSTVSGIAEYQFYIKGLDATTYTARSVTGFTSGDDDKYTEDVGLTQTHTYAGLTAGTEYQMYVKVKDNAGTWVSTEDAVSTGTTESGEIILTSDNLATYLGKYVNYEPVQAGNGYTATVANGAYSKDQTFTTYTGEDESKKLKWRVWNIEGDTLTLISDKVIKTEGYGDGSLYLGGTSSQANKGAIAYNNGVAILNLICKNCYSNSSMNAVARSINLDDIFEVKADTIKNISSVTVINKVGTYSGHTFPTVWIKKENKTNYTDTRESLKVKSNDYGINPYSPVRNTTSDSKVYSNSWYNNKMNSASAWATPEGVDTENSYWGIVFGCGSYWLATRYANVYDDYAYFGLHVVSTSGSYGGVYGAVLYMSRESSDCGDYAVRPLVTIPLSSVAITESETDGMDYDIKAK